MVSKTKGPKNFYCSFSPIGFSFNLLKAIKTQSATEVKENLPTGT